MAPERESRVRPRQKGLRVTTGCLTCRRRQVKCDERRPECANCGKKSRTCRYEPLADGSVIADRNPQASDRTQLPDDATSHQVSPETPIRASLSDGIPDASSPHDSQQVEGSQYPAVAVSQNSATSPDSPFLTTLGSVLLNTELWGGNREPEAQSRDTPDYAEPLGDLDFQWQPLHVDEPIQLSCMEIAIYRNYVENVSRWIDSFSHDRPFRNLVSMWALRCPLLLHSCLAFSSKQLILTGSHAEIGLHESDALRYYRLALKKVRQLLMHPHYAQSDEILAACIILSTYEMIDVVGENLGSHLQGVASLLQSRQVQGYVGGIRGAAYWTWYRHEIWAALQTGRCISLDETYWEPPQAASFENMEIEDIANRVIFILGQCINFSNGHGISDDRDPTQSLQASQAKALRLDMALDDWSSKATPFMACFVAKQPQTAKDGAITKFPIKWFMFPQSSIAHQVYHASKIILALHLPGPLPKKRGLNTCGALSIRRLIEQSREQIFLTANAGIPDAWSLVSAQCLYIAGLVTEGSQERRRTLELIDECQRRSGRKTRYIATELRRLWEQQQ